MSAKIINQFNPLMIISLLCTQSTTIIPGKHSKGISVSQARTLLSFERDLLDTLDQSYGTVWICL